MKIDPVLLNMAASWAMKAYNDKNKDAIKVENKVTGATAFVVKRKSIDCLLYTSPSPRDRQKSRMPSSA